MSPNQLVAFPASLAERCSHFEKFYLNRHSGRRLTWQANLGTADVKTHFKTRSHELNVSTMALIVLLMFEELGEDEELEYEVRLPFAGSPTASSFDLTLAHCLSSGYLCSDPDPSRRPCQNAPVSRLRQVPCPF